MAKIKTPNQKKAYRELAKRLNRYTKRILAIYAVLANEAAKVAISAGYDGDKEFSFDNYPKTKRKVNSLLDFYAENMQTVVYSGITEEWEKVIHSRICLCVALLKLTQNVLVTNV